MEIRNVKHRGLNQFFQKGDTKGLQQDRIKRITQILMFIGGMSRIDELFILKKWHAHQLKGDRENTYSLSISGNWRLTFKYDPETDEIFDLDLEDYH